MVSSAFDVLVDCRNPPSNNNNDNSNNVVVRALTPRVGRLSTHDAIRILYYLAIILAR